MPASRNVVIRRPESCVMLPVGRRQQTRRNDAIEQATECCRMVIDDQLGCDECERQVFVCEFRSPQCRHSNEVRGGA